MDTIKLTKEELVQLIGLRKAKKTYPDMFKEEEAMHIIEEGQISDLLTITTEEDTPAAKYMQKAFKLSDKYHWSIFKRVVNGSLNTYLVPISKEYSKQNPLNRLRTAANFGRVKKAAAKKRRKRTRKTEE